MEPIEKIERLRESADVTFEEARIALEETNWDLLDAVVHLEEQGKTVSPINSTKSTDTHEIPPLPSVKKVVETNQQTYQQEEQLSDKIKDGLRKIFSFLRNNSMRVERDNKEWFHMPLILVLVLFLLSWNVTLIVMVVGLFFDVKYSFYGKDDATKANSIMRKIEGFVQKIKNEFK